MSEFDPLTTLTSRLIADEVIKRVNEFDKLQAKIRATERVLPYISKQETMRDLDISDNTMTKFESNGLQRYKPDYNSSLIYYLIDDICKFIVLAD
ncbi:hypothetical protein P7H38_00125 [Lactococcus raffinolactis]|uniref:hypothetical protein n=1 Tax=Pseudolactococcus raffinolactis TaxID=1366 RepID=UPI00288E1F8C|nr:hypothetical protein [Lactococcus raffinolactis]MDT2765082.1 hypothetical protein [Lactococcus raffinolactis]MDT2788766.1 hypothetical protein [Lactococcus raffinolactis]